MIPSIPNYKLQLILISTCGVVERCLTSAVAQPLADMPFYSIPRIDKTSHFPRRHNLPGRRSHAVAKAMATAPRWSHPVPPGFAAAPRIITVALLAVSALLSRSPVPTVAAELVKLTLLANAREKGAGIHSLLSLRSFCASVFVFSGLPQLAPHCVWLLLLRCSL
jgi:hypothetical protein